MEFVKPAVSVLMPSYNRERYIEAAMESVLASSFHDLELVVVDDCSTDRTADIAKNIAAKDPRVKVYVNKINKGQFSNRNFAIELAKGRYIKFLDSDDIIYPHSLQYMIDALELYPRAGFGIQYEIAPPAKPFPFEISSEDAYRLHFLKGGLLFPGPSAVIFRREVLDEFSFNNNFGSVGDTHLLLQIAAKYDVVALPTNLIYWRIHDEQASEEQRTYGKILWERYLMNQDILSSSEVPLDKSESNLILQKYRRILCRNIVKHSLRHLDIRSFSNCKKSAKLEWHDFVDALAPNRQLKLK
ncbi:glycosyltransferase family 2 protein [Pontibacter pamirensis]|uniref:glycosyltransferase family 2 protein n=1 Tax=Pontibacter pamirensis TaxID=2562824 RepID=UPI00138A3888|nr:glycosyltransferase family 2 protein [Pontibacter pamirensis]